MSTPKNYTNVSLSFVTKKMLDYLFRVSESPTFDVLIRNMIETVCDVSGINFKELFSRSERQFLKQESDRRKFLLEQKRKQEEEEELAYKEEFPD